MSQKEQIAESIKETNAVKKTEVDIKNKYDISNQELVKKVFRKQSIAKC
jgi:hypothetical protein